jgi:hypothetical protein
MGCCDDQISEEFDLYNYIAPILKSPEGGLKAMEHTFPPDDGVKREFLRPFFHDDGSIEYPHRGDEPGIPPDINGYQRDPDDTFLFHPLWNNCMFRLQGIDMLGKSGCIEVVMVCQYGRCKYYMKELQTKHCEHCQYRKPLQIG